ncbi:hypothetical protein FB451DRAFT_95124 [Mycena latifolia]|nr:hypothetical protein FB451DRAFT_95124 [Mycena latifolia]
MRTPARARAMRTRAAPRAPTSRTRSSSAREDGMCGRRGGTRMRVTRREERMGMKRRWKWMSLAMAIGTVRLSFPFHFSLRHPSILSSCLPSYSFHIIPSPSALLSSFSFLLPLRP